MTLEIGRGARFLRRFLRENDFDVRELDEAEFRTWLLEEVARRQRDEAFVQQTKIRDLRRAHPRLRELEIRLDETRRRYEASPGRETLEALDRQIEGAGKAIEGLRGAVEDADGEKRAELETKLGAFRERLDRLRRERQRLIEGDAVCARWLAAEEELGQFRQNIGLPAAEETLEKLHRRKGRSAGGAGASFEDVATTVTKDVILGDFVRGKDRERQLQRLRVLTGVTLGAARVELDQSIVRLPKSPGAPVTALAVVEAKRNINDLAHGFRQRQENVAWLTGEESGYDPEEYRTGVFSDGHFDRPAVHREDGEEYLFDRSSFRYFRREAPMGFFLRRLYLIARQGRLLGMKPSALATLMSRVASDEGWDPDDEDYLRRLRAWAGRLSSDFEAREVLQLYASDVRWARNVVLVDLPSSGAAAGAAAE